MSKRKCNHRNVTIQEQFIASGTHTFEDGVLADTNQNDDASYQATIRVKCQDCGLDVAHSRYSCPKWLEPLVEQI